MIKFFLKKSKVQILVTIALLFMYSTGFITAWRIQERRDDVTISQQEELIIILRVELERYRIIFVKMVIQMEKWEKKIERLERQLDSFYDDMEKQLDWNEGSN